MRFDAPGDTWLGPFEPKPASMARGRARSSDLLTRAGLPCHALADARGPQWDKVVFNSATCPLAALTGLPMGPLCSDPALRVEIDALVAEALAVCAALGIDDGEGPGGDGRGGDRGRPRPQAVDAAGRAGPAPHRGRRPQRRRRRAGPSWPAYRRRGTTRWSRWCTDSSGRGRGDDDEAGDLRRRAGWATSSSRTRPSSSSTCRSTREWFERGGRGGRDRRAARAGRRTAARADRAQEVLPHRRQLRRPPRGARRPSTGRTPCTRGSCSSRTSTRSSGPDDDIVYPEGLTKELDYELELAIVIGRTGKFFDADEAAERTSPATRSSTTSPPATSSAGRWSRGCSRFSKAIDTFCPIGPWIVTADEVPDPQALAMELRVNGEVRQRGNTDDMLISIPHLVAYHSPQGYSAGDLITTGTIRGVAAIQPNPFDFYLQPGDVVEAEIAGVGTAAQHDRPVVGGARHPAVRDGPVRVRLGTLRGRAVADRRRPGAATVGPSLARPARATWTRSRVAVAGRTRRGLRPSPTCRRRCPTRGRCSRSRSTTRRTPPRPATRRPSSRWSSPSSRPASPARTPTVALPAGQRRLGGRGRRRRRHAAVGTSPRPTRGTRSPGSRGGQDLSERLLQLSGRPRAVLARQVVRAASARPGPGSSPPTSCPIRDDIAFASTLDGEPLQSGRTADLIFSIPGSSRTCRRCASCSPAT